MALYHAMNAASGRPPWRTLISNLMREGRGDRARAPSPNIKARCSAMFDRPKPPFF